MAKKTIVLSTTPQPAYSEDGAAAEAITPGHLVAGVTSLTKYNSAGGAAARAFACERDELGKGIDDAYAIGDTVKVANCKPGVRVYALLASGQNVAADARLEAAGAGNLKAFGSGVILGRALEAVNNTAGPGAARIRVEVM